MLKSFIKLVVNKYYNLFFENDGETEKEIVKKMAILTFDTSTTKRKEIQDRLRFTQQLLHVSYYVIEFFRYFSY